MIIADGKAIAQKLLSQIRTGLDGRPVSIAAIWVGDDQTTERFVEIKKKYAESIGIEVSIFNFSINDPEEKIINKIKELSEDKKINGIIVELPLPASFNRDEILNLVPEQKDIDILSESAQKNFYSNSTKLLPPSVGALDFLFKEYGINPKNKTVAVFGQSILIGKPISHHLEQMGAKVFHIDEFTLNPENFSRQADIIISGVGKPNLIIGEMVKDGAIVVDFGFEDLNGKIVGDVNFDSVASKTSFITPVPGGMGPIVIASFLKNATLMPKCAVLPKS